MGLIMISVRRSLLRVALLAAALSVTGAAYAAGPTAADRETARTLMEQGRELRDKGNMQEALKRFQGANNIMHVPTTALEVARAQAALKLLVEARDTIGVLRQMPSEHESKVFQAARAAAEELDATLAGRVPSLTITVKGGEAGQEVAVAIDGVSVPPDLVGLPRTVNPGHHVVTAKTPRGDGTQECDVKEGEQKPVEVTLISNGLAEPAGPTTEAPTTAPETPEKVVSHKPDTLAWIGIGVTGAGVIVGTVTGIMSISKKSTLTGECPNNICGPGAYSTLDSANTLATVSDVAFGLAGAGAVLAVVALVKGHTVTSAPAAPPPASGSTLRVTPWISGNAAGLVGSF
jgi:hypothetical protein